VKADEMVVVDGQAGLPDDAKIMIGTGEDEDEAAPDAKGGAKDKAGEKPAAARKDDKK